MRMRWTLRHLPLTTEHFLIFINCAAIVALGQVCIVYD